MREALTCVHCGAPINRVTMKCEYCGTAYREDHGDILKIETYTNPVKEFKACMLVNEFGLRYGKEYMRYCIEQLANQMLPAVVEGMAIRTAYNDRTGQQKIEGRIRIVIPEHTGGAS